jgi:hypothetical protein
MASAPTIDWALCTVEGCVGSRSMENGRCLAHLAAAELAAALEQIALHGNVDARGVEISSELLQRMLAAVSPAPHGEPRFDQADFREATFSSAALFRSTTFGRFLGSTGRRSKGTPGSTAPASRAMRGSSTQSESRADGCRPPALDSLCCRLLYRNRSDLTDRSGLARTLARTTRKPAWSAEEAPVF